MLAFIVLIASVSVSNADITRIGNWTTGLTHTPGAGNNRLLVFVTSMENIGDRDITNVTYGGQTMTQVVEDSEFAGASLYSRCEIWVLNELGIQAATGNTFVATYSGTPSSFSTAHAAATFQNVDQSVSIVDSASNTSKDQATISTPSFTVNEGGMGVSGAVHGSGGSYDDNGWGAGWVE
ncbi:MAG: hypothetical protein GTO40_25295, partial [Deltaproteobacteria bacterium]|nr:hypothetical protein [Deltaproteobacteria bacterium]